MYCFSYFYSEPDLTAFEVAVEIDVTIRHLQRNIKIITTAITESSMELQSSKQGWRRELLLHRQKLQKKRTEDLLGQIEILQDLLHSIQEKAATENICAAHNLATTILKRLPVENFLATINQMEDLITFIPNKTYIPPDLSSLPHCPTHECQSSNPTTISSAVSEIPLVNASSHSIGRVCSMAN